MPSFWAHRICAGITLGRLEGTAVADIIKRNAVSYRLGSQGADMLYFRPTQFLRGRQGVVYHAKMLHSQPVERLAELSRKYLAGEMNARQFAGTFAYICGFLCHHAVDQKVHPFVETHATGLLKHRRIELDLDAYMSRKLDIKLDYSTHHWTGMRDFIGFPGLSQWYNYMFHSLYSKRFPMRSYIRDYKAMRRMSALMDKPRRLMKDKHIVRCLLPDGDLNAMMAAALEGTGASAALIESLYQSLRGYFPAESEARIREVPQWAGI